MVCKGRGSNTMNKVSKLASVAVIASAALIGSAQAEDRQFSWSMTVGGTSDYIFRGLSLHDQDPAAQGSVDMSYGIFYAGAWASNVGVNSPGVGDGFHPMEVDLYAGIKPTLGQFTFDFGLIGYVYPIAENSLDYYELKAGVSTEIVKNLTGGVTLYYVPDQDNSVEVWTVEGNLAYTLPQMHIFTPTLSGGVGYSDAASVFFLGEESYTYWNAGLALGVEKFTFDFRYWDTSIDNDLSDERFVFSVKATLP